MKASFSTSILLVPFVLKGERNKHTQELNTCQEIYYRSPQTHFLRPLILIPYISYAFQFAKSFHKIVSIALNLTTL